MSRQSDELQAAIDAHPAQGGRLPVFFNGIEGPRFVGYASSPTEARDMLWDNKLGAPKTSRATVNETGAACYIGHS